MPEPGAILLYLLAYLAGDVPEAVRQQIEADETLIARAQELNDWDQIMAVAYEEMDCPQPEHANTAGPRATVHQS